MALLACLRTGLEPRTDQAESCGTANAQTSMNFVFQKKKSSEKSTPPFPRLPRPAPNAAAPAQDSGGLARGLFTEA